MMLKSLIFALSSAYAPSTERNVLDRAKMSCPLTCLRRKLTFDLPSSFASTHLTSKHTSAIFLTAKNNEDRNTKPKNEAKVSKIAQEKVGLKEEGSKIKLESFEGHSYVEGEVYNDRAAEIEAMGGDPFFLSAFDDEDDESRESDSPDDSKILMASLSPGILSQLGLGASEEESKAEWKVTDGTGPRPVEEEEINVDDWDGNAIEDAHFD